MTASTAPSTSHKKGLVMPAAKEHARFFEQYYDAAKTSQPDAYFKAALLAKQWEQAIFVELRAAAEIALAADAAIARLREALKDLEVSANTVLACYTRNPSNFAAALQGLAEYAEEARAVLATPLEAKS